jgi:hypothetical protein
MSFFADQWFLCNGVGVSERPCSAGSSSRRRLQIEDFDPVNMPGFLVITLDGNRVGYGYAKEDADPTKNKVYFFEVLAAGGAFHYVGSVTSHPAPATTQIQGKRRQIRLNGTSVVLAADEEEWTANRPTA